jgi:glycosyltransferase involved in cell wall biosynthesis
MTAGLDRDNAEIRRELVNFVRGDPLIESALRILIREIPPSTDRIIDVGCGIGWTTFELRKALPSAVVRGWGLNASSLRVAARLFEGAGIEFRTSVPDPSEWRTFDFAIAIVTDHDQLSRIEGVAGSGLSELVSADGRLLIAYVDVSRRNARRGTPPADNPTEHVDALASRLGARAERLSGSSGMAAYRIDRLNRPHVTDAKRVRPLELSSAALRRGLVLRKLARHVTDDGYVIPKDGSVRLLIVSPNRAGFSESFIKANIEGLPAHVDVLFGQPPASEDERGRRIIPKWARGIGRFMTVLSPSAERTLEAFWLDRTLAARRPAVVLAEYGPTGVGLLDACRRRSIPLVTQFFGFDASDRDILDFYRDGYRRLLKYGHLVAVSRDISDRLNDKAAPSDRIHYIPCGVDPASFGGAEPENSPPTFLAIGRFVEKKAPHLTIQAFNAVVAVVPEARLRFVGDGPLIGVCRQLVESLGIEEAVEFLGYRHHDELPQFYRDARAFVQHSIASPSGDREGTPVAILEAGASGLPVV